MKQIFRRTSSNLSCYKERRVLPNILPLVDTNDSVKELTLFLHGLAVGEMTPGRVKRLERYKDYG
jgi:hypothetical protein